MAVEDEIEVKFVDTDNTALREKLASSSAKLKTPRRLMKRAVFGGEANSNMTCTYGRVRDEGDVVTMSAKFSAVAGEIESQKEAMVHVDNFDSAVEILQLFGVVQTDYQENYRETWEYPDGTLVELEEWPNLPQYIEIEGPTLAAVRAIADELGMKWEEHTTDSTDKLYAQYSTIPHESLSTALADLRF